VHFDLPSAVDASKWPRSRPLSEFPPLAALADSLFHIGTAGEGIAHERSAQVVGLMLELFLFGPSREPDGRDTILIDGVAQYVRQVWLEGGVRIIGVAELANALGVSPGHLSRSFRDRYGVGPAGGLELIRLGRVAVSLQRTSMLLAEIAGQNGFTDEFHLSKRFARVYGVPPGAYRRRHADDEPLQPIIAAQLMPLWNAVLTHAPIRLSQPE
jgi:AraC family transcriptional regulator